MSFSAEIKDFISAFQAGQSLALNSRKVAMQGRYYEAQAKESEARGRLYEAQAGAVDRQAQDSPEAAFQGGYNNPGQGVPGGEAIPTSLEEDTPEPEGFLGAATKPLMGGDDDDDTDPQMHMSYLVGKGADPIIAAALVGNAVQESGLRSRVTGDTGQSFGLYQFNTNGRMPMFQQWASDNKRDINDADSQHDFVMYDLKTNFPKVYQQMVASKDVSRATDLFMRGYERPKILKAENRISAAQRAFQAYTNMSTGPTQVAQAGPPSRTPPRSAPQAAIPDAGPSPAPQIPPYEEEDEEQAGAIPME